jgi:hypothetical protein
MLALHGTVTVNRAGERSFVARKSRFVADPGCNEIAIAAQGVTANVDFVHFVQENVISFTTVCHTHE